MTPLFVALSGSLRGTVSAGAPLPGVSARRGFLLGLIAGGVHFAGTVYWTSVTVSTFGGLHWAVAVPVTGILVLYMALFMALASTAAAILIRHLGTPGLMLAPAAFVATEYLRGHLFGGFPWIPFGNAVVRLLPIAQLASLVGVYGLSWLLATLNACFALAAVTADRRRLGAAVAALVMVAAPSLWGSARINDAQLLRAGTPLKVGLIQANIPQLEKWDASRAVSIFERYLAMTRDAAAKGADFIVWPESATPFYFDEDPLSAHEVRRLAQEIGKPILFGTDEIERGPPDRYFNSAFLLDTAGATAAVYRKMHLVPFGEYVPFEQLLFFVGPLVEAVSAFSPGLRVTMLPVNGHMASTAICYEVVYPHLIREGVLQGSELLTTITNDAWYGESSAPFQHFELAAMRAIEQGRFLARAANTGISGIVDPYGRVVARTKLFETTTVLGEVRFLQDRTVYAKIGDLAPQIAVFVTLLGVGAALWRGRRGTLVARP
jgi:apolipoprotein N-acyltransferase